MIKVTKNQFRWTVTLNRPDKANAINIAMLDQLNSIMDAAKKENSLRSLIFTGAGKVFSAGADLTVIKNNNEIATLNGVSLRTVETQRYRLTKILNLNDDQDLNSYIKNV